MKISEGSVFLRLWCSSRLLLLVLGGRWAIVSHSTFQFRLWVAAALMEGLPSLFGSQQTIRRLTSGTEATISQSHATSVTRLMLVFSSPPCLLVSMCSTHLNPYNDDCFWTPGKSDLANDLHGYSVLRLDASSFTRSWLSGLRKLLLHHYTGSSQVLWSLDALLVRIIPWNKAPRKLLTASQKRLQLLHILIFHLACLHSGFCCMQTLNPALLDTDLHVVILTSLHSDSIGISSICVLNLSYANSRVILSI